MHIVAQYFTLPYKARCLNWCMVLGQLVRAGLFLSIFVATGRPSTWSISAQLSRSDNPGSGRNLSFLSLSRFHAPRGSHTHVHGIINLHQKTPGLRCTPRVVTTHQSRTAAVLYKLGLSRRGGAELAWCGGGQVLQLTVQARVLPLEVRALQDLQDVPMRHEAHEPLLLLPTQRRARVEIRE